MIIKESVAGDAALGEGAKESTSGDRWNSGRERGGRPSRGGRGGVLRRRGDALMTRAPYRGYIGRALRTRGSTCSLTRAGAGRGMTGRAGEGCGQGWTKSTRHAEGRIWRGRMSSSRDGDSRGGLETGNAVAFLDWVARRLKDEHVRRGTEMRGEELSEGKADSLAASAAACVERLRIVREDRSAEESPRKESFVDCLRRLLEGHVSTCTCPAGSKRDAEDVAACMRVWQSNTCIPCLQGSSLATWNYVHFWCACAAFVCLCMHMDTTSSYQRICA